MKIALSKSSRGSRRGDRKRWSAKRKVATALVASGLLVGGAAAYGPAHAAWVSHISGSGIDGHAGDGTGNDMTVISVTPATGLQPSSNAATVTSATFKLHNPASFPQKVGADIALDFTVSGGKDPANCTKANSDVHVTVDPAAIDTVVQPGADSAPLLANFHMGLNDPEACKGAVFTASASGSATSAAS